MKIAYLLTENVFLHSGLKNKIEGQIKQWVCAGHQVYKVFHDSGKIIAGDGELIDVNLCRTFRIDAYGKLGKLLKLKEQYSYIAKALSTIRPDITYTRYLFPGWGLSKSFNSKGKLIVEVNSDDRSEYFSKHLYTGIYNRLFRGGLLSNADGMIFVTNELMTSPSFSFYTNRKKVIANGISCDNYFNLHGEENDTPQLIFIGTPGQIWQGFDKLETFSEIIPKCTIHIIGPTEEECERLWGNVPENIVVHGYLDEARVKNLIKKMDVGISTLALHRKRMNEACPLKLRQYLAHGLPVITAHNDPDIDGPKDFCFQLPNRENNIHKCKKEIKEFVDYTFQNSEIRAKARKFALNKLDECAKEKSRLEFFDEVMKS